VKISWKTVAATAVLAAGLAASVAVAATPKSGHRKSPSARIRVAPADPQQHLSALAKELNVTDAQLQSALNAARDKLGPPPRPGSGRPSRSALEKRCNEFTDTLASELSLSGDTVRAAIKSVAKDEVQSAVQAGRLTQAQADQILTRINSADCLPPFGPPGPGCHGHGPPPAVQNNDQSGAQGNGLPSYTPSGAPA
jgi:hypothetical protein